MQRSIRIGLSVGLVLLALLWLTAVAATWGEASEISHVPGDDSAGAQSAPSADDEYNFNWLDPDKKIYVLQNRKYLKGGHAAVNLMAGTGFSNPYRSTYTLDPRLSYYVNETWGIEAFYTFITNSPNSTAEALQLAAPNTLPNIREIRNQYGVLLHYVPWYAKINVFNAILYFDWYFAAGAGTVSTFVDTRRQTSAAPAYVQQDLLGLFFNTGHLYHLSQSLIFRLDFSGSFYNAAINGLSGETSWYSNYNFAVGLGWRI